MTAPSLGGREVASRLRADAAATLASVTARGVTPRLAIVVATRDESAAWYVRTLSAAAIRLGIDADVRELSPDASAGGIRAVLAALSADEAVHGIVLQAPVPMLPTMSSGR